MKNISRIISPKQLQQIFQEFQKFQQFQKRNYRNLPAWEARARVAPEGPSGVTAGSSRSPMAPRVPAPFALWPSGASNGPSCPASHLLPGKWEADLSRVRWGPGKGLHPAAAPRPPQSPAQWRGRGAVTTHPGCVG